MRCFILACALIATACSKEQPAAPALAAGTYAGGGRDALCIAEGAAAQRAGFVVYGAGDENCSASGRIESAGEGWSFTPTGDAECKVPLTVNAEQITLGAGTAGCNYYCAPGASFAGTAFRRSPEAKAVTDLAGDPLC